MKWFAAFYVLCIVVTSASAVDLPEVMAAARDVNETYLEMTSTLHIAELRHERSLIEADTELGRLNAELTFLTARQNARNSLLAFYQSVIDSIYDAAVADLELEAARTDEESAHTEARDTEDLYDRGFATDRELIEARLAARSATMDAQGKLWDLADAERALQVVTGLSRDQIDPGPVPDRSAQIDREEWVGNSLAVAITRLREQIAAAELDVLPSDSPQYDRTIAQAQADQARSAARRSAIAAAEECDSLLRSMAMQETIITTGEDQVALAESLVERAQRNYTDGMATALDVNAARVRLLDARTSLVRARQALLKTFLRYTVGAGLDPTEVL